MVLTRTELQNQWKKSTTNEQLKQCIKRYSCRYAFGLYKRFIWEVRNVYRPNITDLLLEWGINKTTFYACCSYHDIKIESSLPQQLTQLIADAYNNGKSINWCQKNFCVGFKQIQKIVNQQNQPQFNPTTEQIKQWFKERKTIKQISKETGVSVFAITKFFKQINIKYDVSILKDDIVKCVEQGLRENQIAKQFNLTRTTVVKYLKMWGVEYSIEQKQAFKQLDKQKRTRASIKGAQTQADNSVKRAAIFAKEIQQLISQGNSIKSVSKKINISQGTVKKICDIYKIPYKNKQQLAEELSKKSFEKWMSSPREHYDYSLVEFQQWTAKDKKIPIICKKHGIFHQNWVNHFSLGVGCPKYANIGPSKPEQEIVDFIRGLGVDVLQNQKILGAKEVDILIKSHNIAIEFNGLFWHSSSFVDENVKYRHVRKTEECEKLGIQLLQINSDEWEDPIKREIWKSIILTKLGKVANKIAARNTTLKIIDTNTAQTFLNENHLQGFVNGKHIGLVNSNDDLLAILTYGKSRFESNKIEILRLCTKRDTIVVGGFSKLVSELRKRTNLPIISYANRRWSNGNAYFKCGFKQIGKTPPSYFYVKDGRMCLTRFQCQKHKLKSLLNEKFDSTKTEQENMLSSGFRIMYDSGNLKFILK